MTTADKIKRNALDKLCTFVNETFHILIDSNQSLNDFQLTDEQLAILTDEERREVENCIKQLNYGRVEFFCKCQGIEIPVKLLNK